MASVREYAAVTAAYWGFTMTDGALRMLVLLHFHRLGFSPLDLAFLFLLYEFMGVVTNLAGGWIGARYGLRLTLLSGLFIQIVALLMLSHVRAEWLTAFSVAYVMAAQALSGIAKDLTKMSSKSAVKLVAGEGEGRLFRWVAWLTGSKNALKGLGFLLGGVMLQWIGFAPSLWGMALMLGVILGLLLLPGLVTGDLGKAKAVARRDLFSKSREINLLSAARVFLFASRDIWFVVGLPIFLAEKLGWGFDRVGGFMAAWVIGYGLVQALAPEMLKTTRDAAGGTRAALVWGAGLTLLPVAIAVGLHTGGGAYVLVGGLLLFGAVFAVNSSVHSYLIVAFSDHDKVALNVGFYYMANAVGRLGGTLLSGLVYQMAGLEACLWVSAVMVALAALLAGMIGRNI